MTYLRAMGSKVPAIYGGSADEAFPGRIEAEFVGSGIAD
jgi:hypothetical protein